MKRLLIITLFISLLGAAPLKAEPVFLKVVGKATILDQPQKDNSKILGEAQPGWLIQATKLESAPDGSQFYEILKIDHDGGGFWFAYNMYDLNGGEAWINKTEVEIVPAPEDIANESWPSENDGAERDVYQEMAQNDLSAVFAHHSPGRLGFIGNDGQRFYLHFTSVVKNKDKPYEYLAKGFTRVRDNICSFEGAIRVKKAMLFGETESPRFKQGRIVAEVELFEEKNQKGSGRFKGRLESFFTIDPFGRIRYGNLMEGADMYANNLFVGSWTSYKTGATKICNFGDGRIPHDGLPNGVNLDRGAGLFLPEEAILDKGWQTYEACYGNFKNPAEMSAAEKEAQAKACKEEEREWWH